MTHCSSSSNNRSRSREQKATHNSISIRGESTKQLLELSLWTKLYWDTHQSQIPDLTWQLWWVPSFINILSCNLFIPQQPESVFLESSVNSLQNQVCLPAQAWFYRLFKNHLHLPEVVCIHLVSKYPSCELGGGANSWRLGLQELTQLTLVLEYWAKIKDGPTVNNLPSLFLLLALFGQLILQLSATILNFGKNAPNPNSQYLKNLKFILFQFAWN